MKVKVRPVNWLYGIHASDAIHLLTELCEHHAKIREIFIRLHDTDRLDTQTDDGMENSSRQFSRDDVMRLIAYRRNTYDWQFIFIGPEEASSYAASIGIPSGNIVRFNVDPAGIQQIMKRLSKSMRAYQLGDRRYALKLRND